VDVIGLGLRERQKIQLQGKIEKENRGTDGWKDREKQQM